MNLDNLVKSSIVIDGNNHYEYEIKTTKNKPFSVLIENSSNELVGFRVELNGEFLGDDMGRVYQNSKTTFESGKMINENEINKVVVFFYKTTGNFSFKKNNGFMEIGNFCPSCTETTGGCMCENVFKETLYNALKFSPIPYMTDSFRIDRACCEKTTDNLSCKKETTLNEPEKRQECLERLNLIDTKLSILAKLKDARTNGTINKDEFNSFKSEIMKQ